MSSSYASSLLSRVNQSATYFSTVSTLYTGKIILSATEYVNQAIWKISKTPTLTVPGIRIGDITEACQKLTHDSPPWGLHWNALGEPFLAHLVLEEAKAEATYTQTSRDSFQRNHRRH